MKKLLLLITISMVSFVSCGGEKQKKDLFSYWQAYEYQSDLTILPRSFNVSHCLNEMKCPSRMENLNGHTDIARFTFSHFLSNENSGSFKIVLMEGSPFKDIEGTYYLENGVLTLCTDGCKKYY